ncbi:MAG: peptidoglycan-binding domain-containing protein [Ginsengibacter sp.]
MAAVPQITRLLYAAHKENFDPKTTDANRAFQKFYGIQQTGIAGNLTLGKEYSLGF